MLLDAVAGVVLSRIETRMHHEVCVVLWTYGTFRHRPAHADFSKQMAATLYSRMPYFAPQGLAMIVKALAQLQWRSEPLLVALTTAAEVKLNAFKCVSRIAGRAPFSFLFLDGLCMYWHFLALKRGLNRSSALEGGNLTHGAPFLH